MINELNDDDSVNTEDMFDVYGNKLNPNLKKMSDEELQSLIDQMMLANKKVKEHSEKWGWGI